MPQLLKVSEFPSGSSFQGLYIATAIYPPGCVVQVGEEYFETKERTQGTPPPNAPWVLIEVNKSSGGGIGPPGPEGPRGPEGKEGKEGPKGVEGPKGEKGTAGLEGPKGATGTEGKEGKEGPKGATGETGAKGEFNNREEWKAATAYAKGDAVFWKGSSYACVKAMTAGEDKEPPNVTFWSLLAKEGAEGKEGKEGKTGPEGKEGKVKVGAPSVPSAYTSTKEETEEKATLITLIVSVKNLAKACKVLLAWDGQSQEYIFNGAVVGVQKLPLVFAIKAGGKWKATGSGEGFESFAITRTILE